MLPRLLLPALLAAAAAPPAPAADPTTGFLDKTYKNPDGTTSSYALFVPPTYSVTKPAPVILFLHGQGQTKGGAGKRPLSEVGIGPYLRVKDREKTFPAIVVFPQAESLETPAPQRWLPDSPDGKRALGILDVVMKDYKTDPDRVYLTGQSMGGYGTWAMAAADPGRWAAIVPICGGGDPKWARKIKDIPCWVWCGEHDKAVGESRDMVAALQAAGGKPRYTELAWIAHKVWDSAYASDYLYDWLFAQKKAAK